MTTSEQRRLTVVNHVESGALVNAKAARLLDLSVRQLQRMKAADADLGAAALSNGNRGRRPVHALDPELARRVVELATATYASFNQQHQTELLVEEHGLAISRPSIHRILNAAGVPAPRKRRPPKARTAGDANFLDRCLPRHYRRFMVAAQDPDAAWMPWPKNRRFERVLLLQVPTCAVQRQHRALRASPHRHPSI